ncbi:MAG: hypothetical protein HQK79_18060, partial [Desulfobacterales bacterium]|nr:hypothetical protein [Desulfobacterales bacterium]
MIVSISLKGIDTAITNLNYRNIKSPKYKLLYALRQLYNSEKDLDRIHYINPDILIKEIWETGDDLSLIKSKYKNFNSIKSSVNADLADIYNQKKNPEGIIIGEANIFEMSDKAKEEMFSSFTHTLKTEKNVSLNNIVEALNVVYEFLSNYEKSKDFSLEIGKLKNILKNFFEKAGEVEIEEISEAGTIE